MTSQLTIQTLIEIIIAIVESLEIKIAEESIPRGAALDLRPVCAGVEIESSIALPPVFTFHRLLLLIDFL